MCNIVGLGMLGLSAGSAIASYNGQSQAAKSQAEYQNSMYTANAKNVTASYLNALNQSGLGDQQQAAQASQAATENVKAGMRAVGTTNAVAAGAGVEGNSVDQLLADFKRQETVNGKSLETSLEWQRQQSTENRKALQAQGQGQITSATPQPVNMPSPTALALNLGSSLMMGVDTAARTTGGYEANKNSILYKKLW